MPSKPKSKPKECEFCRKEDKLKRGKVRIVETDGMTSRSFYLCPECYDEEVVKPKKAA